MTEERRRVTIFGLIPINASAKWIGVPIPFYDTAGVPWIDIILVPEFRWGEGDSYQVLASETCSIPRFGGRRVHRRCAAPFRPKYLPSSPENARARARHVCDVHMCENCLAWAQTLLRDLHFGGDDRGNRSDDSLDGWLDQ